MSFTDSTSPFGVLRYCLFSFNSYLATFVSPIETDGTSSTTGPCGSDLAAYSSAFTFLSHGIDYN